MGHPTTLENFPPTFFFVLSSPLSLVASIIDVLVTILGEHGVLQRCEFQLVVFFPSDCEAVSEPTQISHRYKIFVSGFLTMVSTKNLRTS